MAVGRQWDRLRVIQRAPRPNPQSYRLTRLLHGDVQAWTHSQGAVRVAVIPKRTRSWFGVYVPGSAQRIPPVISSGYGAEYATQERVRSTLVARARLFRSSLVPAPTGRVTPPDATAVRRGIFGSKAG